MPDDCKTVSFFDRIDPNNSSPIDTICSQIITQLKESGYEMYSQHVLRGNPIKPCKPAVPHPLHRGQHWEPAQTTTQQTSTCLHLMMYAR